MRSLVTLSLALILSVSGYAQKKKYDKNYVSKLGYEFIKELNKGSIKVNVSQEYRNIVTVHFNGTAANCKDVLAKLTTYDGRVKEFHDCEQYSFGSISVNDFPVTVQIKYRDTEGTMRDVEMVLTGKNVCYRIDIFKD